MMLKCIKTHDSRVRDLVGSTNRERREVGETDTTYVDPSAVNTIRTVVISGLDVLVHST